MIQFMHYRLHIVMRKNMINLRMIEFYRLGIALLMLMFFAGRASAQASITITESSGAMPNDGIILCGAPVTLTANPPGNTYLWSTMHTTPGHHCQSWWYLYRYNHRWLGRNQH
jgi:hypothetical protein